MRNIIEGDRVSIKRGVLFSILLFLLLLFVSSCTTVKTSVPAAGKSTASVNRVYQGAGKSSSLIEAINLAKMDAVKRAVVDLIGVRSEEHTSELQSH